MYLPPTTVAAIKAQTATRAKSLFTVKAISAIRKSLRQEGTDDKDTGLKQQQSKGAMEMESRWSEMERDGARWNVQMGREEKRREEEVREEEEEDTSQVPRRPAAVALFGQVRQRDSQCGSHDLGPSAIRACA